MAGRTWLAVVLCIAVWLVWARWFTPPPPPESAAAVQSGQTTEKQASAPATPTTVKEPANPFFATPIPQKPTLSERSGNLNLTFSDEGGKIDTAQVTTYHETISSDSPLITPVSPERSTFSLATLFSDPKLESFARAKYQQEKTGNQVIYQRTADGVTLKKDYVLNDGNYTVDATYTLTFPAGSKRDWGYLMLPVGEKTVDTDAHDPLKSWEVVSYQNDSLTRKSAVKVDAGDTVHQGNTSWLAFGNRYFSTVLINQSTLNPDVVFTKNADFVGAFLRYPLRLKEGQNELTFKTKLYIGPKDYSDLSKLDSGLRKLIDYGMFSALAYPLLLTLRLFYAFIHNWGVALVLLTVLVRGLLYPLQLKATRSMKAMQKLQPQIAALKERYGKDPTRFNQEQMALFRAHKVNPAGGCLPMLLQLPVFFALYAVLGNSIELFHAPFFWWIHDLSAKDPYYVFPVLMGISMFAQQKLTPTAGMDATQAKMMLIMPVVFSAMMVNLPSGLTIYIFLSTLLGVAQQLVVNKESGPQPANLAPATSSAGK